MISTAETFAGENGLTIDGEGREAQVVKEVGMVMRLDVERGRKVGVEVGFLVAGQVWVVSSPNPMGTGWYGGKPLIATRGL